MLRQLSSKATVEDAFAAWLSVSATLNRHCRGEATAAWDALSRPLRLRLHVHCGLQRRAPPTPISRPQTVMLPSTGRRRVDVRSWGGEQADARY